MNIVWLVVGGVDKSGTERVIPALLWLMERVARQHHLRVIALNQYPDPCRYELLGATVINLGYVDGRINELKLPRRLWQLRQALQEGPRPQLIHAFHAGECGVLAAIMGKRWQIPIITSIFSGELVWLPEIGYGWQKNWRRRLPVTLSCQLADVVTGGSHYVLAPLAKGGKQWVPLGVPELLFPSPRSHPVPPPWRLLHVAHVNQVKDQTTLLQAVRQVADKLPVILDWFGEDTLNGRLQALIGQLNLDSIVRYHGFQPQTEIRPYYQQAHLLLQSSRHESQGVAVLEAAMTGVPTVGTAVGLIPELAPDAATAVAVGDALAMAKAITTLLENDALRQAKGDAAQVWARHYNADWTADTFDQLYRQLSIKAD